MYYKKEILEKINNPIARVKIAGALGIGEQSVINAINLKRDTLTKYAALQAIKEITGLSEDELFEKEEKLPA